MSKPATNIHMQEDLFSPKVQSNKSAAQPPLSERMRPSRLDQVVGQEHIIGPGKALTELQGAKLPSLILFGPPGCGKTTLARLLAGSQDFAQISAVLSGTKDLKQIVEKQRWKQTPLVLFVDEIHRWNKAQQDALLPYVESGEITLIGATTENPSFHLIAPLLSRSRVFVLKPLSAESIRKLLQQALRDKERGLGKLQISIEENCWELLERIADGDARRGLNALESLAKFTNHIDQAAIEKLFQSKSIRYDRKGEQHYDIISAFIKSMRGSDADAAIYYLARMYEAGEDPRFLARRMIIFASEDIGNADPRALQIAVAAAEAFDRIGQAEGWIPLSNAATYLAMAPKSNAAYSAYKKAKQCIEKTGDLEVPKHLRNAPTKLMKEWGYGEGYEYAHDQKGAKVSHHHLPEEVKSERFYHPTEHGYEKFHRQRLEELK